MVTANYNTVGFDILINTP